MRVLLALASLTACGSALAQQVTLSASASCQSLPPGAPPKVVAQRLNDKVAVRVTSQFTCGATPSDPKIGVSLENATLSVAAHVAPGQPLAACLCAQELSFEITDLPAKVKTIYYVQNGLVYGQVRAP
jgi:hypothetical protein